jgi:hypothetical protein
MLSQNISMHLVRVSSNFGSNTCFSRIFAFWTTRMASMPGFSPDRTMSTSKRRCLHPILAFWRRTSADEKAKLASTIPSMTQP